MMAMFWMVGWIWVFTLIGILAQILILRRKTPRRPGWAVPAVLAALGILRTGLLCALDWPYGVAEELAGHGFWENAAPLAAHLFLGCLPALGALVVWALFRLRRRWAAVLLAAAFVLVFPFYIGIIRDGGSRVYGAVLYDLTFLHRLPEAEGLPYVTGTEFRPLHLEW